MKCALAGFAVDYVPSYLVKILSRPIQGRMTFDPQNRIMGVKRFLAKWKPEIEQAIGKRGYKNFCARYLAREYFKFGISAIQNGDRLGAIRNNIHVVHN